MILPNSENEYYSIYVRDTGAYVKTLSVPDLETVLLNMDEKIHEHVLGEYYEDTYLENSIVKKCPPKPNDYVEWDNNHGGWVDKRSPIQINADIVDTIKSNRLKRNSLLTESDWTQMPDNPLSEEQRENWAIYRKVLRDMTDLDFAEPNWPDTP